MNFSGHFRTINHHKKLVTQMCFKVGLYKQGILHDLSKYHPIEFFPGGLYYQGTRSPISREKEINGYSQGWLHHKGRNKHHFEYWIDYVPVKAEDGKISVELAGVKMPKKYVAEMCIDRICASKNYQKEAYRDRSALEYYMRGHKEILINDETDQLTIYLLTMLADKGEEYFIQYVKKTLLKHRNRDYHMKNGELTLD